MNRFECIENDPEIIEVYHQIAEFEDRDKGWAHHHLGHVQNVAELVESLLSQFEYSPSFIEEAKIAALLHDTGAIEGKENHALRSYEFAQTYFANHAINLEHKELVLEAIKNHSEGFESDNMMTLALILSDKLDIKHTRVAKEGYHIKGMKELQYIKDIRVDIENQILKIQFLCDEQINQKELEEFYFIFKVFKAIRAFAEKMNLIPKVLFNDKEWELFHSTVI